MACCYTPSGDRVAGFLRVSTGLFHILILGLGIWTGTFFDDFPVISRGDIATSTEQHVALLLDLLGMRFSKEGKKWVPFSNQMSALGVVLDTTNFANGSVFFKHTDSRKAELNETLDRHLNEGSMTHKEAESRSYGSRVSCLDGLQICRCMLSESELLAVTTIHL